MENDMPGYKTHLVGGCAVYIVLLVIMRYYNPSPIAACEWLACALAGSLFPDVDIKSKGQKYFYYGTFLLFCILLTQKRYGLFACISICSLAPMLVKHRGIFHELWFIIMAPSVVGLAVGNVNTQARQSIFFCIVFFIAGAISHLLLDRGFLGMLSKSHRYKKRTW
jgi:membrane-bound metal-dependent hydrolase YbcI (DUF457 family)